MNKTVRDKAIIIKQEAKTIEETLDNFKGLESVCVIEKCMKQINAISAEGIEQIDRIREGLSSKGKKGAKGK